MIVAALDLGSNSFLSLVAEGEGGRINKVLSDEVEIVRLGQDVDKTKRLHPEALARAQKCLEKFRKDIDRFQVDKIKAVATSAARDATNSEELFKIGRDLQIPIEIIDGNREAETTYKGAIFDQDPSRSYAVIDIGGGSTEMILGQGHKFLFKKSINVGAVRFSERYIAGYPISPKHLRELENAILHEVQKEAAPLTSHPIDTVVAVAGTPTSLAAVELGGFVESKVHGYELSRTSLENWKSKLAESQLEEKIRWGFEPKRADIIIVGVIVLIEMMKILGVERIKTSTKGVRFGVALDLLSK